MKFGAFEISTHTHDRFRLDGGSMFGAVPKNLWSKLIAVDAENCIPLVTRSLVLQTKDRTILVDVGCGDKWDEKRRAIFAIEHLPANNEILAPEKVTDVIITHMHFDHGGGISTKEAGTDKLTLTYPNAAVHIQKENLALAQKPNVRERASYLPENVLPLEEAELHIANGTEEILPDIFVHRSDGHTRGLQWLEIRTSEGTIAYPSDLIPTSRHLPLPYAMGYDMFVQTLLEEKAQFLDRAVKEDWVVVFEHDPTLAAARIGLNSRGHYSVREEVALN